MEKSPPDITLTTRTSAGRPWVLTAHFTKTEEDTDIPSIVTVKRDLGDEYGGSEQLGLRVPDCTEFTIICIIHEFRKAVALYPIHTIRVGDVEIRRLSETTPMGIQRDEIEPFQKALLDIVESVEES